MSFTPQQHHDRIHKEHGHKKKLTKKEQKVLNHQRLMGTKDNQNPDKKAFDIFKDKKAS